MHENLTGLGERSKNSIENRRELIKYRRSIAASDFTQAGMLRSINAAGINADIVEDYGNEFIMVKSNVLIDVFDDMDEMRARLSEMLPAHLEWDFETGNLTWDLFENCEADWDRWDSEDFSWDMFEVNGHNIFL